MNTIDVRDYEVEINGKIIKFPASCQELIEALGQPRIVGDGEKASYIYDELGISFDNGSPVYLKKNKGFVDKYHLVTYCTIYVCDESCLSGEHAKKPYQGTVTFFGRPWESYNPAYGQQQAVWRNGDDWCFSHIGVIMRGNPDAPNYENEKINKTIYLSFKPERPNSTENYNIVETDEQCLMFDNFNFKLAVIQELMYEQEVLKPYFDIYDYLKFKKSKANTESLKNVKPAVDFFKNLKIPLSLAEKVEKITMDGGNEIYMNICPAWDGEDDRFDLDEVTAEELKQFPNLKKMTVMSKSIKTIQKIGDKIGIKIGSL